MIDIKYLPENTCISGNSYSYEIDQDLNHIVSEYETCVVYQGRRYVCGKIRSPDELYNEVMSTCKKGLISAALVTFSFLSLSIQKDLCRGEDFSEIICVSLPTLSVTSLGISLIMLRSFVLSMIKE